MPILALSFVTSWISWLPREASAVTVPHHATVRASGQFTEYTIPTSGSEPLAIAVGSDGALWFTELRGFKIGRITAAGRFSEFPLAAHVVEPRVIAPGPDGALWFTASSSKGRAIGNVIGRITTAGRITYYDRGIREELPYAYGIAPSPDGNMWFALNSRIGKISMKGEITLFPQQNLYVYTQLTVAPTGVAYFPAPGPGPDYQLAGMEPSGQLTFYNLPTPPRSQGPLFVSMGPGGHDVWFARVKRSIGKLDALGNVEEYWIPARHTPLPTSITAGPDAAMWFTLRGTNEIGRMTLGGRFSEYPIPTPNAYPSWIVAGPDGALWFTETIAGKIGRFAP